MVDAAKNYVLILQKLNTIMDAELITPEEVVSGNNLVKKIEQHTDEFNELVSSDEKLTDKTLKQLSACLKNMVHDMDELHTLLPKVSQRYLKLEEESADNG